MEDTDDTEDETIDKKDQLISWLKYQCRQPGFEAALLEDGCKAFENRMDHLTDADFDPTSCVAGLLALKITAGIHAVIETTIQNLKSMDKEMSQQFVRRFPKLRKKFKRKIAEIPERHLRRIKKERGSVPLVTLEDSESVDPGPVAVDQPEPDPFTPPPTAASIGTDSDSDADSCASGSTAVLVAPRPKKLKVESPQDLQINEAEETTAPEPVSNISEENVTRDSGDDRDPNSNTTHISESDEELTSASPEINENHPPSPAETVFLDKSKVVKSDRKNNESGSHRRKKSNSLDRKSKERKERVTKNEKWFNGLGSESNDLELGFGSDTDTVVAPSAAVVKNLHTTENQTDVAKHSSEVNPKEENSDDFMECTPAYSSSGSVPSNALSVNVLASLSEPNVVQNINKAISILDNFCESPRPSSSGTQKAKAKAGMSRKLVFENPEEKVNVENARGKENLNSDDSENDQWKSKPRRTKNNLSNLECRRGVLNSETSGSDSSDPSDVVPQLNETEKSTKPKTFRKSVPKKHNIMSTEELRKCPKLGMKVRVNVSPLDNSILTQLRREGFIRLRHSEKKLSSTKDRTLEKLSKNFASYDPIIDRTGKGGRTQKEKNKKKSKRNTDSDDNSIAILTSSEEDDNDGDSDRTVTLVRVKNMEDKIVRRIKEIDEDCPSEDESMEGGSELDGDSSEGEALARSAILDLPSFGKKRKTRSMMKKQLEEAKKTKRLYLTPGVGRRIMTESESDGMSETSKSKPKRERKRKSERKKREKKSVKEEIKIEGSSDTDFDVSKYEAKRKKRHKEPETSSNGKKSSDDEEELLSLNSKSGKSSEEDFQLSKTPKTGKHKRFRRTVGSSSDEVNNRKPKKKARQRIDSDSSSGSDDIQIVESDDSDIQEIPNDSQSPSKGRRNIRKLMDMTELKKSTQQATREEEERKKRVTERQHMFNDMFEAPESTVTEQLILDFDPATKAPVLSVDSQLVSKLKPHQCKGIQFMFDACFESVKAKGDGGGCILAHCMGLGKTLQTIGFLHTVMTCTELKLKSALVVCPLNTVGNWHTEFRVWLKNVEKKIPIHKLYESKGKQRTDALEYWRRQGGIAIINYEGLRLLGNVVYPPTEKKSRGGALKKAAPVTKKKFNTRELATIQEGLFDPGPDIVICDEGHILKNSTAKLTQAVLNFRTRRRIVLTGTPLQNNLLEYHTMMSFVKPSLLGDKKEFSNRFLNPIVNGQHKDSSDWDVKLMKRRAHVLHKLLDGCVQRLDYSVLTPFLPPKYEYAININMSEVQKKMYQYYLNNYCRDSMGENFQTSKLFADYQMLVKIWTHPKVLGNKRRGGGGDDKKKKRQGSDAESIGSLKDFIDDGDGESSSAGSDIENVDETGAKLPKPAKIRKSDDIPVPAPPLGDKPPKDWYKQFFENPEDLDAIEISGKLIVLMEILKTCESIGDKVLVFSQYLSSLDLVEELLQNIDRESRREAASSNIVTCFPSLMDDTSVQIGRWRPNIEYFRIDGSTKSGDRQRQCDKFNVKSATKAKLFLISTKAGGLGINLVGANRVVIFDASWNPSHDLQSIFRVFRFGQTKPCYVYRLLARGTMEEKIYNRQVVKLSLSCRVVDEQQIERHFQFDEIRQFYNYDPNDTKERPVPIVPKDRLFADLLINLKEWVFSYLEHDSLLENKEEEELTEEERKVAWDEYNNINNRQQQRVVGEDPWILNAASQIRMSHPNLIDAAIMQMAREARFELQQLMMEWDAIHSSAVSNVQKIVRRAKFDQLFHSLTLKFGAQIELDNVLKKYPPQQGSGASSYIYSYPKPPDVQNTQNGLYANIVGESGNQPPTSTSLNGHTRPKPASDEHPVIIPGSVVTLNQNAAGNSNIPLPQNLGNLRTSAASTVLSSPTHGYQSTGRKRNRVAHTNQTRASAVPHSIGAGLNGVSPSPYQPGRSAFSGRPLGAPFPEHQTFRNLNSTSSSSGNPQTLRTAGGGNQRAGSAVLSSLKNAAKDMYERIAPSSIFSSEESRSRDVPLSKPAVINTRPVAYIPPSAGTNEAPRGTVGGQPKKRIYY